MKNTLSSKLIPLFWAWMVVGSLCLLVLLIPVFTHQRAQFDIAINWVGLLFQGVYVTLTFYLVQLLDGFKTTNDNVNGLLTQFISEAGFQNTNEVDFINTSIGTYSYYTATKK